MTLQPGGPNGRYLGRNGPFSAHELRQVIADVQEQLRVEPEVLDTLQQAILDRDLTTSTEIITHLRDFFGVIDALLRNARVGDAA
jgi:hypothetical protein